MATNKALTVRELLSGQDKQITPLDIDTSEIRELSNCLPKDGSIDLNQAEILATRFLRGADVCAELLAIGTNYASKAETLKKKAYSEAALNKAVVAGMKTDKSKCLYAEGDADYIEACNRYSEALAFVKWVDSKHESFVRAHYLCKRLLERGYSQEKAESWTGTLEENKNGELETTRQAEIKRAEDENRELPATKEAEKEVEQAQNSEAWWEEDDE